MDLVAPVVAVAGPATAWSWWWWWWWLWYPRSVWALVLHRGCRVPCPRVDWPSGGGGADVTQPLLPGGTRPLDPPPPPGSSLAFAACTWNFGRDRRVAAVSAAAAVVAGAVDGLPPAVGRADVARSRSTCAAGDAREECCGAEGGTGGDEAHWRASPQT